MRLYKENFPKVTYDPSFVFLFKKQSSMNHVGRIFHLHLLVFIFHPNKLILSTSQDWTRIRARENTLPIDVYRSIVSVSTWQELKTLPWQDDYSLVDPHGQPLDHLGLSVNKNPSKGLLIACPILDLSLLRQHLSDWAVRWLHVLSNSFLEFIVLTISYVSRLSVFSSKRLRTDNFPS